MLTCDASSDPTEGARRTVTLSFDNGPTETTSYVLDVLRDNAVAATFFVVGSKLQAAGREVLECAQRRRTLDRQSHHDALRTTRRVRRPARGGH